MTDDQRPDLEWPSEDLAKASAPKSPDPRVEWPSADQAAKPAATQPPAPKPAAPSPPPADPAPAAPEPVAPPPPEPAAPQPTPKPPPPEPAAPQPPPTPAAPPPAPAAPQPTPEPAGPPPVPAWNEPPPPEPAWPEPDVAPPPAPAAAPQQPPVPTPPQPANPLAPPEPATPGASPELVFPLEPAAPPEPGYQQPAAYPDQPAAHPDQPGAYPEQPAQWQVPDIPPTPPAPGGYQPPPEFQQLPSATDEGASPGPPALPDPGPYALMGAPDTPVADSGGPAGKPHHFRPDIEGLRAVAILAVLLFHVGVPFTDGGFVGVDVFYVISGFLITGLLLREGGESGKIDLIRFYARRMRRLLPAALLVIVVTLVVSSQIVGPLRLSEIAGDAAASALYVANFHFALDATNYLAVEAPSPLLHYWSLGVEEQFYLVWPLILLLATRIFSLRWVGVFFLVLAVASFALSLYWTEENVAWAFFSPVTRAWELAAGALVAVGFIRIPRRLPRVIGSLAVVLGLTLIVVSVVYISGDMPFPGVVALLPVLGAVLVVVGGVNGPTIPGRILLGNPLSRYLGRISYSLYLWHWPLLILVPLAIGTDDLTIRLVLAGVAVVIAALSTELIERPFRSSSYLSERSRGSIQLGLTGSVAVGVVALFLSGTIALPSNIPMPWVRPDAVEVELAGVQDDLPIHYAEGCHLSYKQKKVKTDCVYGDPEGTQTAMLIGDSHAAQWMPALDAYAAANDWRLEVHTKSACAVTDVPLWERALKREFNECVKWRNGLMKRIRQTDPAAVFVGLSRDYDLWDAGRVVQSSEALSYWGDKIEELLAKLDQEAARVVLLAETPFLNFNPVLCLDDPKISNCDAPVSLVLDRKYAAVEETAAAAAGVELLSANKLLCPGSTCPAVADGIVVFRDKHHITASYMEHLAPPVGRILEGKSPYPSPTPAATATPDATEDAAQDAA